jgi:hypothetical protein
MPLNALAENVAFVEVPSLRIALGVAHGWVVELCPSLFPSLSRTEREREAAAWHKNSGLQDQKSNSTKIPSV